MNLFYAKRGNGLKDIEKGRSYKIFDHQIVPKHELLSRKDGEELMRDLHIQPHQLPYVKASDPASQELSAKPGDILRITRKSPTAGEVIVYRYVVEG